MENAIDKIFEQALREDIGFNDITSDATVKDNQVSRAIILVKENGILSGMEFLPKIFSLVDYETEVLINFSSGSLVTKNTIVANISGHTKSILIAERVALNFLQRMCGIATFTHKFIHLIKDTKAKITDTRKTALNLRAFDKLAVTDGGGVNHRFGLDDMILIKDNHIAASGGIKNAISDCQKYLIEKKLSVKVEVEVKNLDELNEVIEFGKVDRIMFDNFKIDEIIEGVKLVNNKFETEASGNVNLDTVKQIAETGIDFISVGALTHSVKALDLSLEIIETNVRQN